jgi:hypothetical protein
MSLQLYHATLDFQEGSLLLDLDQYLQAEEIPVTKIAAKIATKPFKVLQSDFTIMTRLHVSRSLGVNSTASRSTSRMEESGLKSSERNLTGKKISKIVLLFQSCHTRIVITPYQKRGPGAVLILIA